MNEDIVYTVAMSIAGGLMLAAFVASFYAFTLA